MARSTVICCGTAEKDEQQFQTVMTDTFRLVQQISAQLQSGAKTIKTLDFSSKIVVAPYVNCIKFAMQCIRDSSKLTCIDLTLCTSTSPKLSIEQCQEIAQNEDCVPAFTEEPEMGECLLVCIPEAEDLLSNFSGLMDSVKIVSSSRVADEKELENSLTKEKQEKSSAPNCTKCTLTADTNLYTAAARASNRETEARGAFAILEKGEITMTAFV